MNLQEVVGNAPGPTGSDVSSDMAVISGDRSSPCREDKPGRWREQGLRLSGSGKRESPKNRPPVFPPNPKVEVCKRYCPAAARRRLPLDGDTTARDDGRSRRTDAGDIWGSRSEAAMPNFA